MKIKPTAQVLARYIYKTVAKDPIGNFILGLSTAKRGSPLDSALNAALGTKDALARLELFHGQAPAFSVARAYLNGRLRQTRPSIPAFQSIHLIAFGQTSGYSDATMLAKQAYTLLAEAGYVPQEIAAPTLLPSQKGRWNSSILNSGLYTDSMIFSLMLLTSTLKSYLYYAIASARNRRI